MSLSVVCDCCRRWWEIHFVIKICYRWKPKKEKAIKQSFAEKGVLLLHPSRVFVSIIKAGLSFRFHNNELCGTASETVRTFCSATVISFGEIKSPAQVSLRFRLQFKSVIGEHEANTFTHVVKCVPYHMMILLLLPCFLLSSFIQLHIAIFFGFILIIKLRWMRTQCLWQFMKCDINMILIRWSVKQAGELSSVFSALMDVPGNSPENGCDEHKYCCEPDLEIMNYKMSYYHRYGICFWAMLLCNYSQQFVNLRLSCSSLTLINKGRAQARCFRRRN